MESPRQTTYDSPRLVTVGLLALYGLMALAGMGLALIPETWLVPRMTAFAAARSVDGIVSQAGIDQMLLAVQLAWVAALGAGLAGLAVTSGLRVAVRRSGGAEGEDGLAPAPDTSPVEADPAPRWIVGLLIGLVGVAVAVWAPGLGNGLSYDEAYSALRFVDPSAPWAAFLRFETLNNHPLYSLLAAVATALLGQGEWVLRQPALAAAAAAIPMSFMVGRRLLGWRAGLLAAFLVATSPILAEYSVQARGYSLLFLLSLSSAWFFAGMRDAKGARPFRSASVGWVVVSVLGLWTHLFMGVVILGQVVGAVVRDLSRRDPRRSIQVWALGTLAVLIGGIGYLPVAHRLLVEIIAFTVLAESTVSRSLSDTFWLTGSATGGTVAWIGMVLVVGLATAGLATRTAWTRRPEVLVVIGGPLAIGFLLFAGTDQGVRFFVPLAAMLTVAVAMGAAGARRVGVATAILVMVGAGIRAPGISRADVAGLRAFSGMVAGEVGPSDCLVLEWSVGDVIRYYDEDARFTYDRDFGGGCSTGRVIYGCHFCDRPGPGLDAAALNDPVASVADPTGRPYRLFVIGESGDGSPESRGSSSPADLLR